MVAAAAAAATAVPRASWRALPVVEAGRRGAAQNETNSVLPRPVGTFRFRSYRKRARTVVVGTSARSEISVGGFDRVIMVIIGKHRGRCLRRRPLPRPPRKTPLLRSGFLGREKNKKNGHTAGRKTTSGFRRTRETPPPPPPAVAPKSLRHEY